MHVQLFSAALQNRLISIRLQVIEKSVQVHRSWRFLVVGLELKCDFVCFGIEDCCHADTGNICPGNHWEEAPIVKLVCNSRIQKTSERLQRSCASGIPGKEGDFLSKNECLNH